MDQGPESTPEGIVLGVDYVSDCEGFDYHIADLGSPLHVVVKQLSGLFL